MTLSTPFCRAAMYKVLTIGLLSLYFSDPTDAKAGDPDLVRQLQTEKSDTAKIAIYDKLSQFHEYAHPDSAIDYATKGLHLAKKINFRKGEGMMLTQLGVINEKHDHLQLAKTFFNGGLKAFTEINYLPGMAASFNSLGVIEGKLGNYKPATTFFLKALKINEQIDNKEGIIQSNIKLGVVNEHSNDLNKALQYYNRALKLNPDRKSNAYLSLYNNIGIVHARKSDFKKALSFFQQGIKLGEGNSKVDVLTSLLDNAGNASLELGNNDQALQYYQLALEKSRIFNLPEKEARSLLNLAYFLQVNDGTMSMDYLNQALAISKRIGNKRLTSEIYTAVSAFHKARKNYPAALAALEQQNLYADSLFTLDKKVSIAALQSGYEIEDSKAEIQNLELQNQKRSLERDILIIISLGVLLTLIGMALYVLKVKKLNKQLVASNAIKDKLFSIIGHDLRTPVINLVQMMDVMESAEISSQERSRFIAALKKQSEAALETLDNLLHWGKAQLQGIRVKKELLFLSVAFSKNLDSFSLQISQKSIEIKNLIPTSLTVFVDPDHLNFVIRNLVSNALKFTYPSGTIEITAVQKDADYVSISVKDDGMGISDENKGFIFNSFPVVKTGTANEKGTGIGLMLCKEFVEANGGQIKVESMPGKGSVFSFTLRGNFQTSLEPNVVKEVADNDAKIKAIEHVDSVN